MSLLDAMPPMKPRRWRSRILLLVLMVIPAIPAIFLLIVWVYGKIAGCEPAGGACIIGVRSLGDVAKRSLDAAAAFASFFVFLGGLWFAFALIFVHRSFASAGPSSRDYSRLRCSRRIAHSMKAVSAPAGFSMSQPRAAITSAPRSGA
jgi:hypothetical protein